MMFCIYGSDRAAIIRLNWMLEVQTVVIDDDDNDDDDDDDGRINFNVAYSPKTSRTRNS